MGAIGLNAVFGCKTAGAEHIIAVDINEDKKDIAMTFGATEFINPLKLDEGKKIEDYLNEKYGGVDYAFDCVGNPRVINSALESLNLSGRFTLIGLPHPTTMIQYPAWKLLAGRSIVSGILGCKPVDIGYVELSNMYKNGQYDIDKLVTHRFKLEQIDEAFDLLKKGKCIRSIILFDKPE